jgi:hypothetical protein
MIDERESDVVFAKKVVERGAKPIFVADFQANLGSAGSFSRNDFRRARNSAGLEKAFLLK